MRSIFPSLALARLRGWLFILCWMLSCCQHSVVAQQARLGINITVTLGDEITKQPASGRLLVLFSKFNPSPITGPSWFSPEAFAALNVSDWQTNESVTVTGATDAYPQSLGQMSPGKYYVQAVLKHNPDFAHHKNGVGNFYSAPQRVVLTNDSENEIKISLSRQVKEKTIHRAPAAQVFAHRSALLSAYHDRAVIDRALVLLPQGYAAGTKKTYPVFYEITGFGATIEDMLLRHQFSAVSAGGVDFIHVFLTGQCEWGHHVYANSQTNGPRGDALVKELIPAIENRFNAVAKPYGRMLGGHSSGGWSSLWLQTHYPKFFGGVWSTSPDPVDFRDWQGTNLYAAASNIFKDSAGQRRPLAIANGRPVIWYEDFSRMDDVLERGGQLRSFEAVFSPRGDDGLPVKCWNRETGEVDFEIVKHWKQYDISAYLQSNWPVLKEDLAGKLHVFTGQQDTFVLTEAVRLLKQRMETVGSDAQIEILPNRDHFNLFQSGLKKRIYDGLAEKYRQGSIADGSTSR